MTAIRYCCPLKDCTFSTDKAGLQGGEAASHVCKIHKVTAESLRTAPRGYYKFKIVKVKAEASAPAASARGASASPAKSDKSARSGTRSEASIPKNREARYCCPLKDCTFSIDKAGLLGGEAAAHISKIHKVTAEIMKNAPKGYHKFKKVKVEARA